MKLIRFGEPGRERPGLIVDGGRRIDVSGFGADYDEEFFGSGGLERLARCHECTARQPVASGNNERARTNNVMATKTNVEDAQATCI